MFQNAYQSGAAVEVISSTDKNPSWTISKQNYKHYDRSVKGYVISLDSHSARIAYPDNQRNFLGLIQPFLVLQIYIHPTQSFSFEVGISDISATKRRLLFTSSAKNLSANPLYARIPVDSLIRGVWANISIDLISHIRICFPGVTFRSIDSLTLHSYCKIRRVYTMRSAILDRNNPEVSFTDPIPRSFEFSPGVDYINQLIICKEPVKSPSIPQKSFSKPRRDIRQSPSPLPKPRKSFEKPRKRIQDSPESLSFEKSLNLTPVKISKTPQKPPFQTNIIENTLKSKTFICDETKEISHKEKNTNFLSNVQSVHSSDLEQSVQFQDQSFDEIKESIHIQSSQDLVPFSSIPAHNYFQHLQQPFREQKPEYYELALQNQANRPFTPPFLAAQSMRKQQLEAGRQRDLDTKLEQGQGSGEIDNEIQERKQENDRIQEKELELVYDDALGCYYDPIKMEYYELLNQ